MNWDMQPAGWVIWSQKKGGLISDGVETSASKQKPIKSARTEREAHRYSNFSDVNGYNSQGQKAYTHPIFIYQII